MIQQEIIKPSSMGIEKLIELFENQIIPYGAFNHLEIFKCGDITKLYEFPNDFGGIYALFSEGGITVNNSRVKKNGIICYLGFKDLEKNKKIIGDIEEHLTEHLCVAFSNEYSPKEKGDKK